MNSPQESITLEIAGAQLTATKKELFRAWFERHFNPQPLEFYTKPAGGIQRPVLAEGEVYICAIVTPDGKVQHTIKLPSVRENINWNDAMEWAKSLGGDLPDRVEQAMMLKYRPDLFQKEAYWSNTQHAADSDYAWCQSFSSGSQYYYNKTIKFRGVAVRRVAI